MDFERSLIFPPKLLYGYTLFGSISVDETYNDPGSPYDGFPYRWQLNINVSPQQHSNPDTPTPYLYDANDITVGMWIGQINGFTYQIVDIISVTGNEDLVVIVEDTDFLNLITAPEQTGNNAPYEDLPLLIFNLDDNGDPILNPIQSQSSQLPDYSYWVNDIESRFRFRNYYQKFFYISPGENPTGLTGGDPVYLSVNSTFVKVDSTNQDEVDKLFGFVSGGNLPLPGHLTVLPSGKFCSDLPTLPGATGDVLYLNTVSGSNNLSNVKPATGPVKPVYIKITDTTALMVTSGGGSGSGGSSVSVELSGTPVVNPVQVLNFREDDFNITSPNPGEANIETFRFDTDLTVSLSGGKTFGRYANGSTIPATGLTPAQVITLAIAEPIAPTVNLTSSTTIAFNQTAISNLLNLSYTINTLGATAASCSLEWRRGGVGAWTVLSTSTATPTTYTHSLTDTNFNTAAFNYRFTVTDTVGATQTAFLNITPAAYVAPSISLVVAGVSLTSPETNSTREKGNVNTNLSGSVTRNSPNVALTSYTLQFQVNGGAFSDIGSAVPIGPGTSSITLTNHNPIASNTATTIGYRVKVIDAYQTFLSSQVYSATSTVTFLNLIFYGPSSTVPTTSSNVRALGSRIFTNGSNPFNLNTGDTQVNFTAAMPDTLSITEVIDLDALNANITSSYINNPFNVDDAGGTPTSYKVYTMSIAVPYTSNHRHQITRT